MVISGPYPHSRLRPKPCILWLAKWFSSSSVIENHSTAMAPHFSTLAWKIPWAEGPGGPQSMEWQRVRHNWVTSLSRIGKGNGNPFLCSCLENPRDGGAWWAAVYGVAQSQTRLKWLSSSSSIPIHFHADQQQDKGANYQCHCHCSSGGLSWYK